MARGWESKSVEEQIAGTAQAGSSAHNAIALGNDEALRTAEHQRTDRARRHQSLELQRENILSQRTSNPGRRAALEAALADIERQLAELG